MRRFFDRPDTRWRAPQDCLHVYALPADDDPVRADYQKVAEALAPVDGLGEQPVEHMHATVQRFDAFVEDLADPRWQHLLAALPGVLARHAPLDLRFSAPAARAHAVEAVGEPDPAWDAVLADLRGAVIGCELADVLTAPPFAPHYTVAYCVQDVPDATVEAALAPVAVPTAFRVDRLALVAVDQDPAAGTFVFRRLTEWRLGG